MKRGDIVSMIGRGDFSSKPRPGLIVQANAFNDFHPALTICPITSHITGDAFYRVAIAAEAESGLNRDSEVEVDRLQAIWRERIGQRIGAASNEVMFAVDQALRRWLAL